MAETLVKIGSVVVEIFSEIDRFLPYRFKNTNFSYLSLWCYWTKVDPICTRCRGIICMPMSEPMKVKAGAYKSCTKPQDYLCFHPRQCNMSDPSSPPAEQKSSIYICSAVKKER